MCLPSAVQLSKIYVPTYHEGYLTDGMGYTVLLVYYPDGKAKTIIHLLPNLSPKSNCISIVDKHYHIVGVKERNLKGFT